MIGRLAWRELNQSAADGAIVLPMLFFLLIAIMFPFAVGPDGELMSRIGHGILWMAALLAALLPVDRLVEPDRASGFLGQLALRGFAEESVAFAKLAGHWLGFALPLMLMAVAGAALLALDAVSLMRLELALLAGTPGLAALGLMIAALTSGLKRGGALAGLLMLPLATPLLVFGAAASGPPQPGFETALPWLATVSLLLVAMTPFVAGAAIRAARD